MWSTSSTRLSEKEAPPDQGGPWNVPDDLPRCAERRNGEEIGGGWVGWGGEVKEDILNYYVFLYLTKACFS